MSRHADLTTQMGVKVHSATRTAPGNAAPARAGCGQHMPKGTALSLFSQDESSIE